MTSSVFSGHELDVLDLVALGEGIPERGVVLDEVEDEPVDERRRAALDALDPGEALGRRVVALRPEIHGFLPEVRVAVHDHPRAVVGHQLEGPGTDRVDRKLTAVFLHRLVRHDGGVGLRERVEELRDTGA